MKKSTWIAAAGATALAATFMLTGPAAASATTITDAAPSRSCEIGNVWSRLPEELRVDLRHLRDLEPGEARVEEVNRIREGMLAGEYGAEVQKRAEQVKEHGLRPMVKLWLIHNCS